MARLNGSGVWDAIHFRPDGTDLTEDQGIIRQMIYTATPRPLTDVVLYQTCLAIQDSRSPESEMPHYHSLVPRAAFSFWDRDRHFTEGN
jgi:hypothetical protein